MGTCVSLATYFPVHALCDTFTAQNAQSGRKPAMLSSTGYDVVVIGGSIAGYFAAMHAAERGLSVLMVEKRSFLGNEITATMRPWLGRNGENAFDSQLNNLFSPVKETSEIGIDEHEYEQWFSEEKPLFCGSIKKQLLSTLINQGVHVLLMSEVCGLLTTPTSPSAQGVLIANKYGLHIARSRSVIDVSDTLAISRDWDKKLSPVPETAGFVLEYYYVSGEPESRIDVPYDIGLADQCLRIHKGKRLDKQYYVEFRFHPESKDDIEEKARDLVIKVAAYMKDHHQAFTGAQLKRMAMEAFCHVSVPETLSTTYDNIAFIEPSGNIDLSCSDILNMKNNAETIVRKLTRGDMVSGHNFFIRHSNGEIPLSACSIYEPDDLKLWFHLQSVTFPFAPYLPIAHTSDVVVAGAGTAGALAAAAAAKEGVGVTTVEHFPEPGGTMTMGGVGGYYHGYRGLFYEENEKETELFRQQIANNAISIPVKKLFLRQEMTKKDGIFLSGSIICGTLIENNHVLGIVVTRNGILSRIEGKIVIDATGDGDVSVFAGADYLSGDDRMGRTQNYSQWDINPELLPWGDHDCNRDYDTIDNTRLSELTRALYLSHKNAHYYDFLPLIGVRESRQIIGKHVITLTDALNTRHYEDTIAVSDTDYDPHGFGSSEFSRIGYLLPHRVTRQVEIPYRSIVPEKLDGLLISAKAISATHNAMQFTRMSLDIMQLGYATGLIAAKLVRSGISPRDFDAAGIQDQLKEIGLLPFDLVQNKPTEEDLITTTVDQLIGGNEGAFFELVSLPYKQVGDYLALNLDKNGDRSRNILTAETLAWCRNTAGVNILTDSLRELFEQEKKNGIPPMEVYEPDSLFWRINRIIALLGLLGDHAAVEILTIIAEQTTSGGPPPERINTYYSNRIDLMIIPNYNRILNLCLAFERLADTRCISVLDKISQDPYIGGYSTDEYEKAGEHFFGGYLELRIGAALARCGGTRGLEILIEYMGDIHHLFTLFAMNELESITGESFGTDKERWSQYVTGLSEPLNPVPYIKERIEL